MTSERLKFDDSNFAAAQAFLKQLDPNASEFTFQAFDDNADRRQSSLARILHGPLEMHFPELVKLNRQGAGIFVTINETDGLGRSRDNIVGVRSVWFEDDSGEGITPPLRPHISVESSPGKFHHYFLLTDASFADFKKLQAVMVKLGSDPNAKDVSRVLRLPGFYHQKVDSKKGLIGTPHLVQVVGGLNV